MAPEDLETPGGPAVSPGEGPDETLGQNAKAVPGPLWEPKGHPSEIELIRQAGLFFGRAASPRGRKRLLAAAEARRRRRSATESGYLAILRKDSSEWDELWNLADSDRGDSFFRFPAQFELLGKLLQERAVTAADRRLRVLSAGCGPGYEPYSLAMSLSATRLAGKGWDLSVRAFDLSRPLVARAMAGNFSQADLDWLGPEAARRWFTPRAAGWHFRSELGPRVEFFKLNLAETELESLEGAYDVVFCRGQAFDCPDHQVPLMARKIVAMLAPDGLLFTAPGEIWPEVPGLGLEERSGVVYGRKAIQKGKANVFHVPKKAPKGPRDSAVPLPDLDQRETALVARFLDLVGTDPDEARDLVLELLSGELDHGFMRPQTLALMGQVEDTLGRGECAAAVRTFQEKWA
ncbi:MAG: hypothetical protein LBL95_06505 [Deltaproteobacteria bacterium]|jgi:chemotaxis protein methyltransferase CheR|nr:hypothetical protein [Deltaproteobacteria bacterium]